MICVSCGLSNCILCICFIIQRTVSQTQPGILGTMSPLDVSCSQDLHQMPAFSFKCFLYHVIPVLAGLHRLPVCSIIYFTQIKILPPQIGLKQKGITLLLLKPQRYGFSSHKKCYESEPTQWSWGLENFSNELKDIIKLSKCWGELSWEVTLSGPTLPAPPHPKNDFMDPLWKRIITTHVYIHCEVETPSGHHTF